MWPRLITVASNYETGGTRVRPLGSLRQEPDRRIASRAAAQSEHTAQNLLRQVSAEPDSDSHEQFYELRKKGGPVYVSATERDLKRTATELWLAHIQPLAKLDEEMHSAKRHVLEVLHPETSRMRQHLDLLQQQLTNVVTMYQDAREFSPHETIRELRELGHEAFEAGGREADQTYQQLIQSKGDDEAMRFKRFQARSILHHMATQERRSHLRALHVSRYGGEPWWGQDEEESKEQLPTDEVSGSGSSHLLASKLTFMALTGVF